jgi:signal transduction histidine kinase
MIFASVLLFILVSLVSLKLTTTKIKRVSLDANKISPNQLDQRLSIDKIPNEIVPLANAINRALARVEAGFEEQKRFVANAAHELRTPLTIIRTRIELSELPDGLITDLLQDVTYMSRSVEQLLDLSRAQNSSTYLHKPIPIVKPVTDACQLLGPLVLREDKDLELIVTGNNDSVIYGDHGALTVAFKNIIENAIKHGDVNGLIRVEVGDNWISFSDNGPGIDKKNQTLALQAFWRNNQSSNDGSGLGLAIVNEICKAHNAKLTIGRSISLKGAEITIQF